MQNDEFIFNVAAHSYHLKGRKLPSVSEAIDLLLGEHYGHNRQALLDGSDIHDILAADDEGDLIDTEVPDTFYPYLAQWRNFKNKMTGYDFATAVIEEPMHSKFLYAGTPDRVYTILKTSNFALIDIKTGQRDPKRHRLQLTAYAHLVVERFDLDIKQIIMQAVYLNETGYDIQMFNYELPLWKDFYSAVRVLNYRIQNQI